MGLFTIIQPTWVSPVISGIRGGRPEVAKALSARRGSLSWDVQLPRPGSDPDVSTPYERGGNKKYRALRLDTGNFAWGSEAQTRKTRIVDVVYNASNNELVRTKTLVKNSIIVIDGTPFRQWYEAHYATPLGRRKGTKLNEEEDSVLNKKRSSKTQKKYDERKKTA